ncbi:MAG: aminotransferase class IV [Oscillospiraceae bacterium]|nr:aminotransferase class IV [Oscillospiraceae bacterium]
MNNIAYYNGKTSPIDEMMIPMNDRVVYFGDGVYEVAYVKNHKPFALYDHLDRFYNSCRMMSIDFYMNREELTDLVQSLIDQIDTDAECILYWQCSRGTAPRKHYFPNPPVKPNLLAYVKPLAIPPMKNRIKLITVEDQRFFFCNIKTLNLIPNVFASQKAEEAGCDEAIFHRGDMVTECSHGNISIIKNGALKTAPLNNLILAGTVRKHLLEFCNANGIPVDETPFKVAEMVGADEVIVTSTTTMMRAAYEIDGQPVGGKLPDLVERIQNGYVERIRKELNL